MKKEDIVLSDIKRILLGDAPAEFLLEVLIRCVITYIFLLVVLRLLGKRMSGKLTSTEMAVMLMLGAIVSSAMQIPSRGMLEGCFVLAVVLGIQRLVTLWTFKDAGAEDKLLGRMTMLVKDGRMQLDSMKSERISRNQLFRLLRSKNITNLGSVRRIYMETSGGFSIYKFKEPRPGLTVFPKADEEIIVVQEKSADAVACEECGAHFTRKDTPSECPYCHHDKWSQAII